MTQDAGRREPTINRLRDVAAGLADVGLGQAEDLLRRVSPEGREQARREREARKRRQRRLLAQLGLVGIATLLIWAALAAVVSPGIALAVASAAALGLAMLVMLQAEPRTPGREALTGASLATVAGEASIWLAAQRRGMPRPALMLIDEVDQRLGALAPHFDGLDATSPAAAAVRKLVAVELPELLEGWRKVPVSLRSIPGPDGRAPDDHLARGLRLIEAELASAGEQLAGGSRTEIAVMGRYLELKYDQGASSRPF